MIEIIDGSAAARRGGRLNYPLPCEPCLQQGRAGFADIRASFRPIADE